MVAALVLIQLLIGTASSLAQTAEEIVAKNIRARGGLDKIKAIQTTRLTGRIKMDPIMEVAFLREAKRPDKFRIDVVMQGVQVTLQVYDGKTGWKLVSLTGNKNAEALSGDDLRDAQDEADFDGPLVDYQQKGNVVQLVGREDVEGASAYKLKITLRNGDVIYDYVDADSFLEIKEISIRGATGESETETTAGDYKPVQDVMFPFTVESAQKESTEKVHINIEKIVVNVPLDDSRFTMPRPIASPTKKKPPESKSPPGH